MARPGPGGEGMLVSGVVMMPSPGATSLASSTNLRKRGSSRFHRPTKKRSKSATTGPATRQKVSCVESRWTGSGSLSAPGGKIFVSCRRLLNTSRGLTLNPPTNAMRPSTTHSLT